MSGELDLKALRRLLDDEPTERWPREDIYPILNRLEEAETDRDKWADSFSLVAQDLEAAERARDAWRRKVRAVEGLREGRLCGLCFSEVQDALDEATPR